MADSPDFSEDGLSDRTHPFAPSPSPDNNVSRPLATSQPAGSFHEVQLHHGSVRHLTTTGHGPSDLPSLSGMTAPLGRRITLRTVPFGQQAAKVAPVNPLSQVPATKEVDSFQPTLSITPADASQSRLPFSHVQDMSVDDVVSETGVSSPKPKKSRVFLFSVLIIIALVLALYSAAFLTSLIATRTLTEDWSVTGSLDVSSSINAATVSSKNPFITNNVKYSSTGISVAGESLLSYLSQQVVVGGSLTASSVVTLKSDAPASSPLLAGLLVSGRTSLRQTLGNGFVVDNRENAANRAVHFIPAPGSNVIIHGDLCFAPAPAGQLGTALTDDEKNLVDFSFSSVQCVSISQLLNATSGGSCSSNNCSNYNNGGSSGGNNNSGGSSNASCIICAGGGGGSSNVTAAMSSEFPYSQFVSTGTAYFNISNTGGDIFISPASGTINMQASMMRFPGAVTINATGGLSLRQDVWVYDNLYVANTSKATYVDAVHVFSSSYGGYPNSPLFSLLPSSASLSSTGTFTVSSTSIVMSSMTLFASGTVQSQTSTLTLASSSSTLLLRPLATLSGVTSFAIANAGMGTVTLSPSGSVASSMPSLFLNSSTAKLNVAAATELSAGSLSVVNGAASLSLSPSVSSVVIQGSEPALVLKSSVSSVTLASTVLASVVEAFIVADVANAAKRVVVYPSLGRIEGSDALAIRTNSSDIELAPASQTLIVDALQLKLKSSSGTVISSTVGDISLSPASGILAATFSSLEMSAFAGSQVTLRSSVDLVLQTYNRSSAGSVVLRTSSVDMDNMRLRSTSGNVSLEAASGLFSTSSISQWMFGAATGTNLLNLFGDMYVSSASGVYVNAAASNVTLRSPVLIDLLTPSVYGQTLYLSTLGSRGGDILINTTGTSVVRHWSEGVYVGASLYLTSSSNVQNPTVASVGNVPLELSALQSCIYLTATNGVVVRSSSVGSSLSLDASRQLLTSSSATINFFTSAQLSLSSVGTTQNVFSSNATSRLQFNLTSSTGDFYFQGGSNSISIGGTTSASKMLLSASENKIWHDNPYLYIGARDKTASLIIPTSVIRLDNYNIPKPLRWEDQDPVAGTTTWSMGVDDDKDFSFYYLRAGVWDARVAVGQDGILYTRGGVATWSSRTVKRDIYDIAPRDALELVMRTQAVTYHSTNAEDRALHIGYIAEELALVVPHASSNRSGFATAAPQEVLSDDSLETRISEQKAQRNLDKSPFDEVVARGNIVGVKFHELVPLLSESIKALKQEIEDLRAEVAAVKQTVKDCSCNL